MTIYLCVSMIVVGLALLAGTPKTALTIGVAAVADEFGYRIYSGEEFRAVTADAFFVVALLPIGWWAAKQRHELVDAPQTTDSN